MKSSMTTMLTLSPEDRPTADKLIGNENKHVFMEISDYHDTSIHFSLDRMHVAFPDIERYREFTDKLEIINRLDILLQEPLSICNQWPIWWSRGRKGSYIDNYESDKVKQVVYLNEYECVITRMVVYLSCSDFRDFVYLEFEPQKIIECNNDKEELYDFFNSESYQFYDNTPISASEADRGYVWNNGTSIKIEEKKLKTFCRFITSANLVITGQCSYFVKKGQLCESIFDEILRKEKTPRNLVDYINFMHSPIPD